MRIRIAWPAGALTAVLRDTPTARTLATALPHAAPARLWGNEVYIQLPLAAEREPDAAQEVPAGTVCYWIEGNALAFPFGPTPISETETPKLAAPCNLLGHLEGRWDDLADVSDGDMIRVEWADPGQFTQQ